MLLKRGSVIGLLEEEDAFEPFGCFCFVDGMVGGGRLVVAWSWEELRPRTGVLGYQTRKQVKGVEDLIRCRRRMVVCSM